MPKYLLTKVKHITSKKGEQWVIIDYVNLKTGSSGQCMLLEADFRSYNLPSDIVLTEDDLKSLATDFQTASIVFNEKGRLETIATA